MLSSPNVNAPPLAATVAALPGDPKSTLDRLRDLGFRRVQLSATRVGMRPRDLDRSARRDLAAALRRRDMVAAGLDAWIPPEDVEGGPNVDRALGSLLAAIELAADLGRIPVSVRLPEALPEGVEAALVTACDARDVPLADHAVPARLRPADHPIGVGVDPAAHLACASDPAETVLAAGARLRSARLVDLDREGMRLPIGAGGRLEVTAYRVALSVAQYRSALVIDTRRWSDPWAGLEQTCDAWGEPEPLAADR